MKHPLTQRNFRNWLKGRPANEIVGRAREATDCPCQRCIREIRPELSESRIYVWDNKTWTRPFNAFGGDGQNTWANPKWLGRLVNLIDDQHRPYANVTAGTVRKLFRQATRRPVTA